MVADQPATQADQDRGACRPPRPCHRPDGARYPRRDPPIASAIAMHMTAILAQTEQKRQDRSVRCAEKHRRRARTRRLRRLIRPVPAACATKDAGWGEKCLSSRQNQAILTSEGRPLGECRSKLLNSVDPVHLRELKTFNTLEKNNLVILGEGRGKKHGGKCRLCYKSGTWLKGANDYRNRFTHESPYGTLPEENVLEVYQPDCDDTLFMAKAFFAQEEGDFPPNVLRTTNHLYQNICGFFLLCSEFTGYSSDPPSINLTNDM